MYCNISLAGNRLFVQGWTWVIRNGHICCRKTHLLECIEYVRHMHPGVSIRSASVILLREWKTAKLWRQKSRTSMELGPFRVKMPMTLPHSSWTNPQFETQDRGLTFWFAKVMLNLTKGNVAKSEATFFAPFRSYLLVRLRMSEDEAEWGWGCGGSAGLKDGDPDPESQKYLLVRTILRTID